jgi:L,D-peptidoglycan transpeptidase YkuD (ErfK/YbiS/YcfS/YnhG family)
MDLRVDGSGFAFWGTQRWRCALGRAGISRDKHEGDGATPAGSFVLRRVFYRPDREAKPQSFLPCQALTPEDGWCDDPADPAYNQPVRLAYRASAEALWRSDHVYDLIVVLGYNDAPVVKGRGSAIFLHLAQPDYAPTAGCVALARDDLLALLRAADAGAHVMVG